MKLAQKLSQNILESSTSSTFTNLLANTPNFGNTFSTILPNKLNLKQKLGYVFSLLFGKTEKFHEIATPLPAQTFKKITRTAAFTFTEFRPKHLVSVLPPNASAL